MTFLVALNQLFNCLIRERETDRETERQRETETEQRETERDRERVINQSFIFFATKLKEMIGRR